MTPDKATSAVIYTRVSTREQGDSQLGLDAQEAACRSECSRRGWVVVGVFREVVSGERAARPLFDEACDLAREHHGVLLGAKADRLSRGGPMKVLPLYERAGREGWSVFALDMPEIDTTSGMGEFVLTVISGVNRLERRMIGERTRAALRQAQANGVRVGRPRVMPTEIVDKVLGLRAKGLSYRQMADVLNAEGPLPPGSSRWRHENVYALVKRYSAGREAA